MLPELIIVNLPLKPLHISWFTCPHTAQRGEEAGLLFIHTEALQGTASGLRQGAAFRHISIKKTFFLRNWTVFKSSWLCLLRLSQFACSVTQSCPSLLTPWTIAHQAPVHGLSQARIEEQVAFFSPGDLPNTRIEPIFPVSTALADGFFTTKPPGKPTQQKTGTQQKEIDRITVTQLK